MNRLTKGILIAALCLSSTALAENFRLYNKTDGTIHGACGSEKIHSVPKGEDREFSCSDNQLRVYNSDASHYNTGGVTSDPPCRAVVIYAVGEAVNPNLIISCRD